MFNLQSPFNQECYKGHTLMMFSESVQVASGTVSPLTHWQKECIDKNNYYRNQHKVSNTILFL